MSVVFFKDEKLFHLTNGKVSMYLQISENGAVLCPYFGKYISEFDAKSEGFITPDWYSTYYDKDKVRECKTSDMHFNSSSFLVPFTNFADSRPSLVEAEGFQNDKLIFLYRSHRIYKGKPTLCPLPYVRDEQNESETLEITLWDKYHDLTLKVSLTVFEKYNCVIRNTTLENHSGKSVWLTKAMSLSQDFCRADMDIVHFPGEWCNERQFRRERLTEGCKVVSSASGRSSHEHNPFVMLCDRDANETFGEVYAFSLMYSGSFKCNAFVGKTGVTRLNMGINDEGFKYELRPDDEFVFPEGVCVYSCNGFGNVSRQMHDLVRNNIVKDNNVEAFRSILLNSWEGCYMDFDTGKVLDLIRSAKKIGVGLFVLDDGWFGSRDDDERSLGDWFVNSQKIDLRRIIDECHENGMLFGLWFEPEMGNLDSDFLREHPQYAAVDYNTNFWLSRHQVALNFADEKVVDAVYERIADILSNYRIDYVKWDHNRQLEDCFAANLDGAHQGEFYHRNTLGYYRLAKMLTERFDHVHFQGCASGGGRFDLGTLFYFPEIWTSDENDPVQRLFIQYGMSFCYPPSVSGSHVNDCKITDYKTKAEIALFGSYGFELDPRKLTEKDVLEIRKVNEIFKKYHDSVVLEGDMYRLISPFDKEAFAIQMVSKDKSESLFLFVNLLKKLRARRFVKLQGLKEDAYYVNSLDDKAHKGEYYMNVGLNLSYNLYEFDSYLVTLQEVENETV